MIRGSLILLAFTAIAIVWHYIDFIPKSTSSPVKIIANGEAFFPEQRFLINGPFDINKATVEELEAIPYIGPSMAGKISEFRNRHGPIAGPEELLEINGVGPRILERISPYIKYGTDNAGKIF